MSLKAGLGALCAVSLAASAALAPGAASAEPVPHRAAYSLTLGKADPGGRFVDVKGTASVVHERTCDAWITAERVQMQIDTRVGGALTQALDFSGWESLDGRRYRFAARSTINGEATEYKGSAYSNSDKPGEAAYARPKEIIMPLPEATKFYFGFVVWLVEQAAAGKTQVTSGVFDGTDDEGPQKTVTFIVPRKTADRERTASLGSLAERPGWSMRIAYYPIGGRAAVPDYEIEADVLDNGVTTRLLLEFPSFTAVQTLTRVEALEAPKC